MNEPVSVLYAIAMLAGSAAVVGLVLWVGQRLFRPDVFVCLWCQRFYTLTGYVQEPPTAGVAGTGLCHHCARRHDHPLRAEP